MVTQKEQNQMMDYLVNKLEESYEVITPQKKILGEDINNILLSHDAGHSYGAILLVDKEYPNDGFEKIYRKIRMKAKGTDFDVGAVLYKDGKTFFRTAAPHCYFTTGYGRYKQTHKHKPVKRYSDEEIHRMIMLRPEEIFLYKHHNNSLQYYQPSSSRLEEGIVSFDFKDIIPDYSHIPPEKFKPDLNAYERDHIWQKKYFNNGNLVLDNRLLLPREIVIKDK